MLALRNPSGVSRDSLASSGASPSPLLHIALPWRVLWPAVPRCCTVLVTVAVCPPNGIVSTTYHTS